MKKVILTLAAVFGFTALAQAQIQVKQPTSTTTVSTTPPSTKVDFEKKQIIKTDGEVITTTRTTTSPGTVIIEPKRTVITKTNKKYYKKNKSKFPNGHDNRTKSQHYNNVGHDDRKR